MMQSRKKLTKSNQRIIFGVLGGFGEYFNIDPIWLRIIYAALTIFTFGFPGILLYLVVAMIMPSKPIYRDEHGNYRRDVTDDQW